MKTQVFQRVLLMLCVVTISSPSWAGQCLMQRLFRDDRNIMRHFSMQKTSADGQRDASTCRAECKRMAGTIAPQDAAKVQSKKGITKVQVDCIFNDRDSNGIIGKTEVGVSSLRLQRSATQSRVPAAVSGGSVNAPVSDAARQVPRRTTGAASRPVTPATDPSAALQPTRPTGALAKQPNAINPSNATPAVTATPNGAAGSVADQRRQNRRLDRTYRQPNQPVRRFRY